MEKMKHRNKNRKSNGFYTVLCHVFNYLNRDDKMWIMYLFLISVLAYQVAVSIQTRNLYKGQIDILKNRIFYLENQNPSLKHDFQNVDKQ